MTNSSGLHFVAKIFNDEASLDPFLVTFGLGFGCSHGGPADHLRVLKWELSPLPEYAMIFWL